AGRAGGHNRRLAGAVPPALRRARRARRARRRQPGPADDHLRSGVRRSRPEGDPGFAGALGAPAGQTGLDRRHAHQSPAVSHRRGPARDRRRPSRPRLLLRHGQRADDAAPPTISRAHPDLGRLPQGAFWGSPLAQAPPSPRSIFSIAAISSSSMVKLKMSALVRTRSGLALFGSTGYRFCTAQRSRTWASLTPYFLAMTLNGASACSPSAFISSVFALSCPSAVLQVESGTRLL